MRSQYEDFELIVIGEDKNYWIWAVIPGITSIPERFEHGELEKLHTDLRSIEENTALSRDAIREVGKRLFNALFPGKVAGAYHELRGRKTMLRIKLTVLPPELSRLPWELVFDPDPGDFLALYRGSTILRSIPDLRLHSYRSPAPPLSLRVLYLHANPSDTSQLRTDYKALLEAVGRQGEVVALHQTDESALRDVMRDGRFDVVHYDGHGAFVDESFIRLREGLTRRDFLEGMDLGYLAWHGNQDESDFVSGTEIARVLADRGLRLVVLSACETGMDSKSRRFSGVAHELMRKAGLPAVVAMQFKADADYTPDFTRAFYKALVEGLPVNEAVTEGRCAIWEKMRREEKAKKEDEGEKEEWELELGGTKAPILISPHWATPALFMVSENGYIFGTKQGDEVDLVGVSGEIERPKSLKEGGPRFFKSEQIECSGTVSDHEPGMRFWLVTVDQWDNKFPKCEIDPGTGEWHAVISEEGEAEEFSLALYAVKQEVHDEILKWGVEGAEKKDFPAFPLPDQGPARRLRTVEGLRRALHVSLDGVKGHIEPPKEGPELLVPDLDVDIECSGWVEGLKPGVHLWLVVEKGEYDHKFPKGPELRPVGEEQGRVEWSHTIHHKPTCQEDSPDERFDLALYAVGSELHFEIQDALEARVFSAWPSEQAPGTIDEASDRSRRLHRVRGLRMSSKKDT
jgi:hypothetical protein